MAKWSSSVKTKWHPPEGLFTRSSREIANVVRAASPDLKTAASRITFYVNRAGRNLSPKDRARILGAIDLLHGSREHLAPTFGLSMQTERGFIHEVESASSRSAMLAEVNRLARRKRRR